MLPYINTHSMVEKWFCMETLLLTWLWEVGMKVFYSGASDSLFDQFSAFTNSINFIKLGTFCIEREKLSVLVLLRALPVHESFSFSSQAVLASAWGFCFAFNLFKVTARTINQCEKSQRKHSQFAYQFLRESFVWHPENGFSSENGGGDGLNYSEFYLKSWDRVLFEFSVFSSVVSD